MKARKLREEMAAMAEDLRDNLDEDTATEVAAALEGYAAMLGDEPDPFTPAFVPDEDAVPFHPLHN